jgi:transposase-like protein
MKEEIVVPYWNNKCPKCSSDSLERTKGSVGNWVREYKCNACKTEFEFNEGDKMGEQFDIITILN